MVDEQETLLCVDCNIIQKHDLSMCSQCYGPNLYTVNMAVVEAEHRRKRRIRYVATAGTVTLTAAALIYLGVSGDLDVWDIVRAVIRLRN